MFYVRYAYGYGRSRPTDGDDSAFVSSVFLSVSCGPNVAVPPQIMGAVLSIETTEASCGNTSQTIAVHNIASDFGSFSTDTLLTPSPLSPCLLLS